MAQSQPFFTQNEIDGFVFEFRAKFRDGVRSADGWLYVFLTLMGVAWATWAIPAFNNSHTSPETFGVYAIGFLVTLLLDALLTWKKKGDSNRYEQAIAVVSICTAFTLIVLVSYFSVGVATQAAPGATPIWKTGAYPVLICSFIASVVMALVLTGFETSPPKVGPLDLSVSAVEDRNG